MTVPASPTSSFLNSWSSSVSPVRRREAEIAEPCHPCSTCSVRRSLRQISGVNRFYFRLPRFRSNLASSVEPLLCRNCSCWPRCRCRRREDWIWWRETDWWLGSWDGTQGLDCSGILESTPEANLFRGWILVEVVFRFCSRFEFPARPSSASAKKCTLWNCFLQKNISNKPSVLRDCGGDGLETKPLRCPSKFALHDEYIIAPLPLTLTKHWLVLKAIT